MKFRAPFCLLMIALPLAVVAAEVTPTATPAATPAAATPTPVAPEPTPKKSKDKSAPHGTPRPTILKKWLRALGIQKTPSDMTATGFKGLEIGLKSDPPQVQVGETKQLKITVTLVNRGKKITQLDFPTSQRIEVLVKSKEGKMIEQWSEDQAFSNEPSLVTVNPGERLEYLVSVPTRDMAAGETYSVEAFFPNFDQLRKAMTVAAITPVTPTPKPTSGTPSPAAASPAPAPAAGKSHSGKGNR